jgi:hypothetical protein
VTVDEGKTHYVGDGCQPAHDPRIDQAPPGWPHPTYIELERQVERLRAVAHAANGAFLAFAKAPPELADDHELMRAMSTLGAALDSYDTLRESS